MIVSSTITITKSILVFNMTMAQWQGVLGSYVFMCVGKWVCLFESEIS